MYVNKSKIILIFIFILLLVLPIKHMAHEKSNVIDTFMNVKDNFNVEKKESNEDKITQVTSKKEFKGSSDVIGKIKIDGTNIQEEIVQGNDNKFYLNHSKDKTKNIHGSVFMDFRNTLDDRKLLIYGHNSQSLKNALFHDLEKYLEKNFYDKHKYIDITLNNETSRYEIFSVMIVKGNDKEHLKITFNDIEWNRHIDWILKNSLYKTNIEVGITDKIITLQTCYYNPKNSYLIVNAKKI